MVVLVLLVLGGLATLGAAAAVERNRDRLAAERMDRLAGRLDSLVTDEVDDYRDALTDLAAGIGSQNALQADEFADMTSRLSSGRLPGAVGVCLVVPAHDAEVATTQALWRSRGATGLTLYRTGTDIQHKYVVFAHSFGDVPLSTGRDLSSTPQTGDALDSAAATGAFTMSSAGVAVRERLLPAAQQQISFTLAVPIYRGADLHGWVTMGVRGGDFLTDVLRDQANGRARVRITDPAAGAAHTVLEVAGGTPWAEPSLNRKRDLLVGQHVWQLEVSPTTALLSGSERRMTQLTLLAGFAFSLLLALLVAVLAGARNKMLDQVDRATAALRQDIERRREVEAQLQELAFHDQLTGLANRELFYDRVGLALHTHAVDPGGFAVLFIDLDGFKLVNDELGHSAGDTVLREVAARLRACLRDGDLVARFGGDEFAIVVERLDDPADVRVTADRIVAAVRRPIDVGPRQATVTASVGIALNRAGDSADDILREADMAMYLAKSSGKSRHVLAGG